MRSFELLDIVALTADIPEKGLMRGQVGTVVELLDSKNFEIEFCDNDGHTYAMESVDSNNIMLLNYHAVAN